MKLITTILLLAACHAAWTSYSNLFTAGFTPYLTTSGSKVTIVTFGNPWNTDICITYGLESIMENKKQKMTWSTLIDNITPSGFDITFNIVLPTQITDVRMRILLHPVNFHSILALTSIEFAQSDMNNVRVGTGPRTASATMSMPGISFDLVNTVKCLVMLQGVDLDGSLQKMRLDSAMVSGSTYEIKVTVDSDTTISSLFVGVFIFDVTTLQSDINIIVDYGIMTSYGMLAEFDLMNRVANVDQFNILFGISGFSTHPNSDIQLRYDPATKSWLGLQNYNLFQIVYWTIQERVPCSVGYAFESRRADICSEVCGDGMRFDLPCDDGNNIDDDGCSAACQIEANATCSGGSASSPDICTVKRYFDVNLILTMKHFQSNTITFYYQLFPEREEYLTIDFLPLLQTNISGNLSASYVDGLLQVDLSYDMDLHNLVMELVLDMKLSNLKYFSGNDRLSKVHTVYPDNNLAALNYSNQTYENHEKLDIAVTVILVLTLVLYVGGLFVRKYVGVEMIAVVQVAYIGMAVMDDWTPLMSVYARLQEVNGLNIVMDDEMYLVGSPRRLLGMDISCNFLYDFNISLLILFIPYLLAAIFYGLSKRWSNMRQYSQDALHIYGLSAVLVVLYQWTLALWTFTLYTKKVTMPIFAYDLVSLFLSSAMIIPNIVLFGKNKQKFGDFTTGFNDNSQFHYWIIIGGRLMLSTILAAGVQFRYIGFVCCLLPLAMIVWLAVRKPYVIVYDNYRALGNEVTVLLILLVYAYYGGFVTDHREKVHDILPYFIVVFLFLCLLMNLILLLAILLKKLKDKLEDEEDLKLVRMSHQESQMNQQLNKRTIGMVRQRKVRVKNDPEESRIETSKIDSSRQIDSRQINDKLRGMDTTMIDNRLLSARLATPRSDLLQVPPTNRSRIDQLLRQIPHNKSVVRTKQQLSSKLSTVSKSQKRTSVEKRMTLSQFTKKFTQK